MDTSSDLTYTTHKQGDLYYCQVIHVKSGKLAYVNNVPAETLLYHSKPEARKAARRIIEGVK